MSNDIAERAAQLHRDAVICDMTLPWMPDAQENRSTTLPRFCKSGFSYISLTVGHDRLSVEGTSLHIAFERSRIESRPDEYVFVESVDDILRAKKEGKLALGFHFQGTNGLFSQIPMIEFWKRQGVQQIMLCYNLKNSVGDGCHELTDAGLSRFGISAIQEMNRVGILVDCTHTGYRTTMEAMELSTAPVIFSHSNAKQLRNHDRNITDDQIKACAKTGGVIGMNGMGIYIADNDASTEELVKHIDYMSDLVGAQHVGLGLDFVYYPETFYGHIRNNSNRFPPKDYPIPQQFFEPEQLPGLTELLLRKGYSDADVRGILGENFLRVARHVWKRPDTRDLVSKSIAGRHRETKEDES